MASDFYNFGGERCCFWTPEDSAILTRVILRGCKGDDECRKALGRWGEARRADEAAALAWAGRRSLGETPADCAEWALRLTDRRA